MSKELTAEEYYKNIRYMEVIIPADCKYYGDLRAKEAVKEFAEELMEFNTRYGLFNHDIKALAKQKGVEI